MSKDAAGNWSGDTAISSMIKLDTTTPVTTPSAGTGICHNPDSDPDVQ